MKNKLTLEIVSQDKKLLEEVVDSVTLETTTGEITILPNHTPLLSKLKEGILKYTKDGKEDFVAIFGGFIDVSSEGKVNILADSATRADTIDIANVEKAKEEAEKSLKEQSSELEFALAETALRKAALELKVAKKYASRQSTRKL